VPDDAELPPDGVVLGVVAPLEGEVEPLDGEVDPLVAVPVELVDELVELVALAAFDTVGGAEGTLNCGTPAVSVVPVPPPPQAASPTPSATESTIAPKILTRDAAGWSATPGPVPRLRAARATETLRSRAAPCACRTSGSR
jgi:hypothetical protein